MRREVERELVARQQPLHHDRVEERQRVLGSERGQGEAHEAVEGVVLEGKGALLAHLQEGLPRHAQPVEGDAVAHDPPFDLAGAEAYAERLLRALARGRGRRVVARASATAPRIATQAGHPKVGRARVEDDVEALRRRAYAERAKVERVLEVAQHLSDERR